MADREAAKLRRLSAELRVETSRVGRTVAEAESAAEVLRTNPTRLAVYGSAALLETFYTGVEKSLLRVAAVLEDVPEGPGWHRELLERMAIDVPKVRPAVLTEDAARKLEHYLAFRHRFRNLYLFDLRSDLIESLLEEISTAWKQVETDIGAFASFLESLADGIEEEPG